MAIVELQDRQVSESLEAQETVVGQIVERAKGFLITSKQDASVAIDIIGQTKKAYKSLEDKRKEIIAPARAFINRWNDSFSVLTTALDSVEQTLKGKYDHWKKQEAEALAEKSESAAIFAESLNLDVFMHVEEDTSKLRAKTALSYEKTEWKHDVEDLSIVPREFLRVDEDKVKLALKSGIRKIPGLRVYEEKKTIIRSR